MEAIQSSTALFLQVAVAADTVTDFQMQPNLAVVADLAAVADPVAAPAPVPEELELPGKAIMVALERTRAEAAAAAVRMRLAAQDLLGRREELEDQILFAPAVLLPMPAAEVVAHTVVLAQALADLAAAVPAVVSIQVLLVQVERQTPEAAEVVVPALRGPVVLVDLES